MEIAIRFSACMKNADLIRALRIVKDAAGPQLEEAYSIVIDLFEIIEPQRHRRREDSKKRAIRMIPERQKNSKIGGFVPFRRSGVVRLAGRATPRLQ